jgi:hypothetical protein
MFANIAIFCCCARLNASEPQQKSPVVSAAAMSNEGTLAARSSAYACLSSAPTRKWRF